MTLMTRMSRCRARASLTAALHRLRIRPGVSGRAATAGKELASCLASFLSTRLRQGYGEAG